MIDVIIILFTIMVICNIVAWSREHRRSRMEGQRVVSRPATAEVRRDVPPKLRLVDTDGNGDLSLGELELLDDMFK